MLGTLHTPVRQPKRRKIRKFLTAVALWAGAESKQSLFSVSFWTHVLYLHPVYHYSLKSSLTVTTEPTLKPPGRKVVGFVR